MKIFEGTKQAILDALTATDIASLNQATLEKHYTSLRFAQEFPNLLKELGLTYSADYVKKQLTRISSRYTKTYGEKQYQELTIFVNQAVERAK